MDAQKMRAIMARTKANTRRRKARELVRIATIAVAAFVGLVAAQATVEATLVARSETGAQSSGDPRSYPSTP